MFDSSQFLKRVYIYQELTCVAMNASQYHFGLIKDCEILAIVCYTESGF